MALKGLPAAEARGGRLESVPMPFADCGTDRGNRIGMPLVLYWSSGSW